MLLTKWNGMSGGTKNVKRWIHLQINFRFLRFETSKPQRQKRYRMNEKFCRFSFPFSEAHQWVNLWISCYLFLSLVLFMFMPLNGAIQFFCATFKSITMQCESSSRKHRASQSVCGKCQANFRKHFHSKEIHAWWNHTLFCKISREVLNGIFKLLLCNCFCFF